jgi:hypothetical protein
VDLPLPSVPSTTKSLPENGCCPYEIIGASAYVICVTSI